jgi:mono/diheme cytochrome c family protein
MSEKPSELTSARNAAREKTEALIRETERMIEELKPTSWHRKRVANILLGALLLFLASAISSNAQVDQGQKLFEGKCYSCHNIGSGDKKGPDLKGVTTRRTKDWILGFVATPQAIKSSGDAAAAQLFTKYAPEVMPDQTLTPTELDSILALIDDLATKGQSFVPAGAKLYRAITPGDAAAGMNIFTGRAVLSGGGASCISCHSVNNIGRLGGGTLGPDLTAANLKYRDPELISILQNPNFPTMATVFAKRPLNNEEIVKVFAFLQQTKIGNPTAVPLAAPRIEPWFIGIGFAAVSLTLFGFNFIWRNRHKGVREELVRRTKQ